MKEALRSLAWRIAPWYAADRIVRWNAAVERKSPDWVEIEQVEDGPFAGIVYPKRVVPWVSAPELKRRGQYEPPLAALLSQLLTRASVFVDIGASDGYYAIGAARGGTPTIAYESSTIQRRNLRLLAAANGVSLDLRGHCRRVPPLPDGAVVLVDIEGGEDTVLNADAAVLARHSIVLVELHERVRPGVTQRLEARFAATHAFELIEGPDEPGRQERPHWAHFTPRQT